MLRTQKLIKMTPSAHELTAFRSENHFFSHFDCANELHLRSMGKVILKNSHARTHARTQNDTRNEMILLCINECSERISWNGNDCPFMNSIFNFYDVFVLCLSLSLSRAQSCPFVMFDFVSFPPHTGHDIRPSCSAVSSENRLVCPTSVHQKKKRNCLTMHVTSPMELKSFMLIAQCSCIVIVKRYGYCCARIGLSQFDSNFPIMA